jgi:hypothetical protein
MQSPSYLNALLLWVARRYQLSNEQSHYITWSYGLFEAQVATRAGKSEVSPVDTLDFASGPAGKIVLT